MIGRKFAPLTFMNNEDADMGSTITTFDIAVTPTANEILGKHRQKKKPSENNIERCMKKAKENWIGEQSSEI